jgi:ribosomal protein S18 acetylase RimI-like enzyme
MRANSWVVPEREVKMTANDTEVAGVLETDSVLVRTMREDDLDAIVAIDAAATGRRRPRYFELMLQRAVTQATLQISLVAELDDRVVGFVIGTLYYGEYGVAEPSASIDAITVSSDYRGKKVGKALMRQLRLNLSALRITTLRTEVSWQDLDLLGFFKSQGFALSSRLCLERILDPTRSED